MFGNDVSHFLTILGVTWGVILRTFLSLFGDLFVLFWKCLAGTRDHFSDSGRSFFVVWGGPGRISGRRFFIDFWLILERISVSLWLLFWYLFRWRTQPAKPSKTIVVTMNLHVFTFQKNMICDEFHGFCLIPVLASLFDDVWHRIRLHFGNPLISNSMFSAIIFSCFFEWYFHGFRIKMAPTSRQRHPYFFFIF